MRRLFSFNCVSPSQFPRLPLYVGPDLDREGTAGTMHDMRTVALVLLREVEDPRQVFFANPKPSQSFFSTCHEQCTSSNQADFYPKNSITCTAMVAMLVSTVVVDVFIRRHIACCFLGESGAQSSMGKETVSMFYVHLAVSDMPVTTQLTSTFFIHCSVRIRSSPHEPHPFMIRCCRLCARGADSSWKIAIWTRVSQSVV
jgi:hypothetical protein